MVAATGTAVALPGQDSVDSGDIENGAVKEQDLAPSQRTLWALIDGSSDEVIRSSGGVTIAASGNNFDWINFHESLKGRSVNATVQTPDTSSYVNAVICGSGSTEETTPCDTGESPKQVYVETANNDANFYVTASPK